MYEDVIAQVPLFSDLTQREQQILSANCREREYPAGAALLRQGETGVGLFIITSGKVQVSQQGPDGTTRDLGTFDRGSVLGEMSLLDDLPRTASAVARRSARALRLARSSPAPVGRHARRLRSPSTITVMATTLCTRSPRALGGLEIQRTEWDFPPPSAMSTALAVWWPDGSATAKAGIPR